MTRRFSKFAFASLLALSGSFISFSEAQAAGCGGASWYALTSRTASGERMNPNLMTAAHRSLRFGTKVKVTNANNGRSVVVRINDRGPFIRGRILDLSKAAASQIGMIRSGHAKICYQIIG
ncbi:septal ring lytic transglycosylase RlpA family protein [Shinella daejeonensis]|uniref:septal ring lytic transglycosylase RlpA family protein n=1 Tax=Shinella daejeonensis TaxID=659017 RepID=UPI0020C79DAD|nr:septal ring lytic transglycosylase RlpA family protein [Shinella daejeonensis]MCP8897221.1 septal ring lytic transglycosylase RlpA family protein [Shinella daejeonensis]